MNKEKINQLNPTEGIINSLPKIIEAFVAFYGEEERERITAKFQNMLVVGYSTPTNLNSVLRSISNEKSEQLINEFLDIVEIKLEERDKWKKILFDSHGFDYPSLHPINDYINYLSQNEVSGYIKWKLVEFLKQIYPDVTLENVDDFIKQGKFQDLNTFIPSYEVACNEYKKFAKELQPYTDYINRCNEIEKKLKKKYSETFIEEIKDLFNEEEYKEIKKEFENKFYYSIKDVNGKTKNYIGYSLDSTALVDAFSEESDLILVEGSSWKMDSIKRDRIQYFKNLGVDLGGVYEDYMTNPEIQAVTPSKELVNRIISTRQNIHVKFMNEYCESLPEYQKNQARIDELNLLDKDTGYDAELYYRGLACICPNLKFEKENYTEYPILYLNIGLCGEYFDEKLIHELNHVYELSLTNVNEVKYETISGWDNLSGTISAEVEEIVSFGDRDKRKYELFNEIINELISQEISQIMSDMGIYVFNTPEDKKIKGGTSYERTIFLVRDFYDTYKKEIIESRKSGNISVILDTVGKENFDALNDLFHEYYENFNEFSIITTYRDLEAGKETEQTNKFKEIVLKRNEILNNMNEYHQSKNTAVY